MKELDYRTRIDEINNNKKMIEVDDSMVTNIIIIPQQVLLYFTFTFQLPAKYLHLHNFRQITTNSSSNVINVAIPEIQPWNNFDQVALSHPDELTGQPTRFDSDRRLNWNSQK